MEDGADALAHAVALGNVDERLEVDVDVVLVLRAGAVDEYVHVRHLRQRRKIAHVELVMYIPRVRDRRRLPVDAHHLVSRPQKPLGDGAPDAARRAGDQYLHLRPSSMRARYSRPTPCSFHFCTALYPKGEKTISMTTSATAPVSAHMAHCNTVQRKPSQ